MLLGLISAEEKRVRIYFKLIKQSQVVAAGASLAGCWHLLEFWQRGAGRYPVVTVTTTDTHPHKTRRAWGQTAGFGVTSACSCSGRWQGPHISGGDSSGHPETPWPPPWPPEPFTVSPAPKPTIWPRHLSGRYSWGFLLCTKWISGFLLEPSQTVKPAKPTAVKINNPALCCFIFLFSYHSGTCLFLKMESTVIVPAAGSDLYGCLSPALLPASEILKFNK